MDFLNYREMKKLFLETTYVGAAFAYERATV
jgi:hypothetical protein